MSQQYQINKGDIVKVQTGKIGIVVGVYGSGYYEVLLTRKNSSRIVPFRQQDLICIEHINN